MQTGVASEDAMVAVGINLHVELFAKLYEVFGIFRAILEMNVIIRHAMVPTTDCHASCWHE